MGIIASFVLGWTRRKTIDKPVLRRWHSDETSVASLNSVLRTSFSDIEAVIPKGYSQYPSERVGVEIM